MPLRGRALTAPADVTDLLRTGLTLKPNETAIVSRDDSMTWRQLEDASTRLARSYRALGLAPGERVASLMPNRIALVVRYLARFKAGLVATPSSISHIGSFLWTLASFMVGAKVIHAQAFDAGEVLPLLREHRPTVLAMIPAALTAIVRDHDVTKDDFSSRRVCRCGADEVFGELEKEFS